MSIINWLFKWSFNLPIRYPDTMKRWKIQTIRQIILSMTKFSYIHVIQKHWTDNPKWQSRSSWQTWISKRAKFLYHSNKQHDSQVSDALSQIYYLFHNNTTNRRLADQYYQNSTIAVIKTRKPFCQTINKVKQLFHLDLSYHTLSETN